MAMSIRETSLPLTRGTEILAATIDTATPVIAPTQVVLRGLYAITPDLADTALLVSKTREALRGGVRFLQYRNKRADRRLATEQALALRAVTQETAARLIINDDADLAVLVNADGVHLGRDDGAGRNFADLRRKAGTPAFIVGVSCYNELPRALAAAAAGADYVAFGSFFPSPTKPDARRAEFTLLQNARAKISIPVVAIGGITLENAPGLIAAGADALAVISALFDAPDISSQALAFNQLF